MVLQDETYHLRITEGVILPRTWHIANLKKFYPQGFSQDQVGENYNPNSRCQSI
ncbi:hypothetical protein BHE74_00018523 [Ensete ventricosum]|nr:hypothetical protein BHE74_00018523 [Ensete ventricosum]